MKILQGLFKRLRNDNRGAAIVMVIVALSFIGILGVTVMWISLSNYRMKVNDQENKQGFYTAESVLEQIKIGLQGDASQAAGAAYAVVMQNFSSWTEAERESRFQQEFKKSLIGLLEDGGTSGKYSIEHLKGFVDGNLNISTDPADKGVPIRYLGARSNDPNIKNTTNGAYLVLENLELEYTDDEGYYSRISTDIVVEAPFTTFMDTSTLPPVFKYALIADTGLEVGEGSLNVKGSVYAGEEGLNTNKDVQISDASYTVSKGPINVEFGNETLNVTSNELYASEIKVRNANININSNTRVADDLTLNGNSPSVTLSGSFTGFGDSQTDTGKSSAILVNGLNTGLNMSGLSNLLVAGHSYIGTGQVVANASSLPTADGEDWSTLSANNADVMMGESISVKGNQLAYLIPDDCIGVVGSKTVIGKNPLTYTEYKNMTAKYSVWGDLPEPGTTSRSDVPDAGHTWNLGWQSNFDLVSTTKAISTMGGNTLSSYMPSGGSYQMIFAPSSGETMVYFYMKFADSDAANRYSKDYYTYHKNKMDAYADVYASNLILPSGAIVGTAASTVSKNGVSVGRGDPAPLTNSQKKDCQNFSETYQALCANLTQKYSELTTTELSQTVFENLIDEAKIVSATGNGGTKEYVTTTGFKAIVTDGQTPFTYHGSDGFTYNGTGYVYNAAAGNDKIRMILSTHDVYVNDNFKGIIIAKGKIVIGNSVTVTSIEGDDTNTLKDELMGVLQRPYDPAGSGTDLYRPIDYFYNGSLYISANAGLGGEIGGPLDFSSSVLYQNWVKE